MWTEAAVHQILAVGGTAVLTVRLMSKRKWSAYCCSITSPSGAWFPTSLCQTSQWFIILKPSLHLSSHFLCGLYMLHYKSLLPKNFCLYVNWGWCTRIPSSHHLDDEGVEHRSQADPWGIPLIAASTWTQGWMLTNMQRSSCTLHRLNRYLFPGRTAKFYWLSISSNTFCLFCCRRGDGEEPAWLHKELTRNSLKDK